MNYVIAINDQTDTKKFVSREEVVITYTSRATAQEMADFMSSVYPRFAFAVEEAN